MFLVNSKNEKNSFSIFENNSEVLVLLNIKLFIYSMTREDDLFLNKIQPTHSINDSSELALKVRLRSIY